LIVVPVDPVVASVGLVPLFHYFALVLCFVRVFYLAFSSEFHVVEAEWLPMIQKKNSLEKLKSKKVKKWKTSEIVCQHFEQYRD